MRYVICFISLSFLIGCDAQTTVTTTPLVDTPVTQTTVAPKAVPVAAASPIPKATYVPFPEFASDNIKYVPSDALQMHITYIDDPANASVPLAVLNLWGNLKYEEGGSLPFAITRNGVSTSCMATVVLHDAPMNVHRIDLIGIEENHIAPNTVGTISPWLYVNITTWDSGWFYDKQSPCQMASGYNGSSFIHYGSYASTAVNHMKKFTTLNY